MVLSWWNVRKLPNILIMKYEDMKRDLPGAVRMVAKYLNVRL